MLCKDIGKIYVVNAVAIPYGMYEYAFACLNNFRMRQKSYIVI